MKTHKTILTVLGKPELLNMFDSCAPANFRKSWTKPAGPCEAMRDQKNRLNKGEAAPFLTAAAP